MNNVSNNGKHCDACAISKAHRNAVSKEPILSRVLDLVYSDVAGPMDPMPLGERRFAISFIDRYSRYGLVYFMRTKAETVDRFQQFCAEEVVPRALRTDSGGEYIGKGFVAFCRGVKQEFTAPYSPHQNGVTERRSADNYGDDEMLAEWLPSAQRALGDGSRRRVLYNQSLPQFVITQTEDTNSAV